MEKDTGTQKAKREYVYEAAMYKEELTRLAERLEEAGFVLQKLEIANEKYGSTWNLQVLRVPPMPASQES